MCACFSAPLLGRARRDAVRGEHGERGSLAEEQSLARVQEDHVLVEHVAERRQQPLRRPDGERAVRRTQGGALLAEVELREWVGVACESQEQPEHSAGDVMPRADRRERLCDERARRGDERAKTSGQVPLRDVLCSRVFDNPIPGRAGSPPPSPAPFSMPGPSSRTTSYRWSSTLGDSNHGLCLTRT